MSHDPERERGILSPADRAYLRDRESYSRQASREREIAIKQRLTDGVLDLAFLFEYLPADIHADVFGRAGMTFGEFSTEDFDELDAPVAAGIGFLYSIVREREMSARVDFLEDAIRRAEERAAPADYIVDVDVSIDPQPRGTLAKQGAKKIDAGERVTDAEIRAMLQEKTVNPEDVAAYLQGEDVDLPHWGALE